MGDLETRNTALAILGGLLLGTLTGAIVGLLVAPGSGQQTRAEIEDAGDRLRARTDGAVADLRKSMEELTDSFRHYVEDTKARAGASIEAGKQAAAETHEQLSNVVEKQTGQSI